MTTEIRAGEDMDRDRSQYYGDRALHLIAGMIGESSSQD